MVCTGQKQLPLAGWFVFAVVCIVTMLDFGIIFSLGAMFVALLETFQADRSSTATVQSLLVGISLSFSVVSGALITKFGLRVVTLISSFLVPFGFCVSFFVKEIHHLYITISIISGIGISSIHVISIVVIQRKFPPALHPLCFAIHGVGVNIAGIVYPLLIGKFLENYGVHGTFLILGGVFMNSFATPLLMLNRIDYRREHSRGTSGNYESVHEGGSDDNVKFTNNGDQGKPLDNYNTENDHTEAISAISHKHVLVSDSRYKSRVSSLLTKQYIFLLAASALCIPALNTFLGLTVDIFVWKGFTVSQGLFSFVPFNIFSLLSKFIPVLAKRFFKGLSCFVLPVLYCVCGLLSQLLVCFTNNYILMLIGASLAGLSLGGVFPAMLIAGAKIVRKEEWPVASGLLMTVVGVLSSALGPLFGSFRDRTDSYTGAVLIISFLQAAGALMYLFALISRRKMIKKKPVNRHLPEEMTGLKSDVA